VLYDDCRCQGHGDIMWCVKGQSIYLMLNYMRKSCFIYLTVLTRMFRLCSIEREMAFQCAYRGNGIFFSSPSTRHGGAWGERKYSSYSFTTSALDGGEWSASRPGRALRPGKEPQVPIEQESGWAPEPVWTQRLEENSFAPAGDRTPIARSSSP
jgi:hypothetical protein